MLKISSKQVKKHYVEDFHEYLGNTSFMSDESTSHFRKTKNNNIHHLKEIRKLNYGCCLYDYFIGEDYEGSHYIMRNKK